VALRCEERVEDKSLDGSHARGVLPSVRKSNGTKGYQPRRLLLTEPASTVRIKPKHD